DAAKAVIDLGKYSLFPDYKELFLDENKYNSEVIWQIPANNSVEAWEQKLELACYPNGYSGHCLVNPLQNLVDDYEMLSGKLPKDDPNYNPQIPYVNRDPRFYASILYDGAMFIDRPTEFFLPNGLDSPQSPIQAWNASQTGYAVRKFLDERVLPANTNVAPFVDSPWVVIRYAEILLNYAEAMYNLGDEDICRQYINMVRSRPSVMMPPITESGQALLAKLQNERRIELVFEEHRYFDVRRWKIAPEVLNIPRKKMSIWKNSDTGIKTYTVEEFQPSIFHERNYLAPIPQSEIDKNPLLEQNPGY
uniref:RagB/SusD family nutrient uptake outer membrane protein n=1 Tax=Mariniphaga sediminis TaxID=1628158 RepID=UPI003566869C